MAEKTRPGAPVQPVRGGVHAGEAVVDQLLLAERLGDGDAAHGLVHVGGEVAQGAPRLGDRAARHVPEAERGADDQRHQQQGHARHQRVDREQIGAHQHHQHRLADQLHGQRHDLREGLRVGRHAADHLAGGIDVVEGQVMAHQRRERVVAQAFDHAADGAGSGRAAVGVEQPAQRVQADDRRRRAHHPAHRDRSAAGQLRAHAVDGAGDHDRQEGAAHRRGQDRPAHRDDPSALRPEPDQDAAHQLPVAVRAVVRLGLDAVHQEPHQPGS